MLQGQSCVKAGHLQFTASTALPRPATGAHRCPHKEQQPHSRTHTRQPTHADQGEERREEKEGAGEEGGAGAQKARAGATTSPSHLPSITILFVLCSLLHLLSFSPFLLPSFPPSHCFLQLPSLHVPLFLPLFLSAFPSFIPPRLSFCNHCRASLSLSVSLRCCCVRAKPRVRWVLGVLPPLFANSSSPSTICTICSASPASLLRLRLNTEPSITSAFARPNRSPLNGSHF